MFFYLERIVADILWLRVLSICLPLRHASYSDAIASSINAICMWVIPFVVST